MSGDIRWRVGGCDESTRFFEYADTSCNIPERSSGLASSAYCYGGGE